MKIKRVIMMAVLAVAVAALVVPVLGLRAGASVSATAPRASASVGRTSASAAGPAAPAASVQDLAPEAQSAGPQKVSKELLDSLGIRRLPEGTNPREFSRKIGDMLRARNKRNKDSNQIVTPQSGQPLVLNANSALSAALITTIGGRDNQFSEVTLIADWDGREDCVADRENKVDDFSFSEIEIDFVLSEAAISEHTVANGFAENVFYYGDSVGNFWVGTDDADFDAEVEDGGLLQLNIPELVNTGGTGPDVAENGGLGNGIGDILLLNPQGTPGDPLAGDCTDDQVTVTSIAVNPVADLADFGMCGTIGEVVYVSVLDTEGCSRNAANQVWRTRIFAFGFADNPAGGVTPLGAIQIVRNSLWNIAGVTVDDDGSLYFQLTDNPQQALGAAIFKVCEGPRTVAGCDVNPRVNRVISSVPSGLSGGIGLNTALGTGASPVLTAGGFRLTNYSGNSTTFGNIVAIDAGPCNTIYAAVSRSAVATDDAGTQLTEGLFTNPSALGATPSMIISFADCSGAFDTCTSPAPGVPGQIPIADGFADVAASGITRAAGVNNFRVFALGNGPDIRPAVGGTAVVPGTLGSVLKVDMQIDYTPSHSGIAVNEEGTVFVISGGMPAGVGKSPSPMLGEVLCFEDMCPMDRRADFVDLRGNGIPNPPASGGNIGDGDSDRFDHIFYQSPLDQVTLTPGGMGGLATGFLRYTNRLAPTAIAVDVNSLGDAIALGQFGGATTQDDDSTAGVIIFEAFDPGHQVAGGDDQNTPFRGDDNDGAGNPVLVGAYSGGFEFLFGGTGVAATCVWNGFFLNSNGNITFGGGDTTGTPGVQAFREGLPRIAPAWTDLNPDARADDPTSFPVQALGFANVNAFRIRWINVPQFGDEDCTGPCGGATNTFGVTLYDDGTGRDENEAQALDPADPTGDNVDPAYDEQEGPTDLRFVVEPTTGLLIGCPPRPDGTGHFIFDYCRMDLLGTEAQPVIAGFSVGGLSPLNPPGLCEINLSTAAAAADTGPFGVIQGQTASIMPCLIGEGTEPTIFELFNEGRGPAIGAGGEIVFATPDFDLRGEGNDAALCTPPRQRDANRGKVGFFGVGCLPPPNPLCVAVTPVGTIAVAPGDPAVGTAPAGTPGTGPGGTRAASPTAGIINALCNVQLNLLGCGFFPNEVTIICQGFSSETGVPLQRPGKTVSTAIALTCDTNADGIPDVVVPLAAVTPVNKNLLRGTLATLGAVGLPGTAFPVACCGGIATLTVTTTFTAGDNNIFGPFTRTTVCTIDLGLRAPVVFSATPSEGDCAVPQDLLISGACFIINGVPNVTSVFAQQIDNANNRINATAFVILNANLIDAIFNFGSANAGRRFLIFVSGPNGTSRNLTSLPAGAPAGCPLGNEQGIQVTFTCRAATPPGGGGTVPDIAVVTGCRVERSDSGTFTIDVLGRNFKAGATATVGGRTPKKIKFRDVATPGGNDFTRLVLKGRVCGGLPGIITVTNPGASPSVAFNCAFTCASN